MIDKKIRAQKALRNTLARLKAQKKTVVFTNGCFDIIHAGHALYLEDAKKEGDILVVAVNSDQSVSRLKGKGRPLVRQGDRMKVLASLESVDFVTLFTEDDPERIIRLLGPNVIVKGADWKKSEIIGAEHVRASGGRVVTVPFRKGYSTTALLERMKRS